MVTHISQCPGRYCRGHRKYGHADITMSRQILLRAQKRWSRRYHTAQADIIEGTVLMDTQISYCLGKYYWGYRADGHAHITMPRQILLRAQKIWSRRYHNAQADTIEGTDKMVTQISHCQGRYYWEYRTDGHTDITLPRQILLRAQNWWSHRYHTVQTDIIEGT
jgi:signal transduction histidine kinase